MLSEKIAVGIDVGSTAIKICLYDGTQADYFTGPTGWNPAAASRDLLNQALLRRRVNTADRSFIVGTGYGRVCLDFIHKDITEITCHARGAVQLCPAARTVIDVGGQDAKTILITPAGRVEDFIMNDKCAAGTGRFLQVMANRLGMDVAKTGEVTLGDAQESCAINSMCTVFAESEVIGLLNRGFSREAIISGLIESTAGRIAAMASRINPEPPIVFTGGLAHNKALRLALESRLGTGLVVPDAALHAGAFGAALIAWDIINKQTKEEK